MKLPFDKARWMRDSEGEWLCLRTENGAMARRFVDEKRDKLYDAELKEHRQRRSIDANAYCWVLLGKLAEKSGLPPAYIYQTEIQNIGGNHEIVPLREDAIAQFRASWCKGHLGRIVEEISPARKAGYINCRVFYGSSDYDTKQMAQLIDAIVQDCKSVGVETDTPEMLARYKEEWK